MGDREDHAVGDVGPSAQVEQVDDLTRGPYEALLDKGLRASVPSITG